MQTGALGALHRANDALHLLATAAWLAACRCSRSASRPIADPSLSADAVTAMRRFSFWGQFDVALVVLTGIVNFALTSGFGALAPTTPYRVLLGAKLALVATMVALALFNRYVLAPRLASERSAQRAPDARLRRRTRPRRDGRRAGQRLRAARSELGDGSHS